jgi:hypothetical protein
MLQSVGGCSDRTMPYAVSILFNVDPPSLFCTYTVQNNDGGFNTYKQKVP